VKRFHFCPQDKLSNEKELPVSHTDGEHDETELPTRGSCPTRHAFATAVKTEVSNEKELRELHVNGAHGETEMPDETVIKPYL